MEIPTSNKTRIGEWGVGPTASEISRGGESIRLEFRAMRLLLYLSERPGEVVSIDELIRQVWSGVHVSPDSVYQAVASLRRILGDDPKEPTYIETVPRLGYRLVAPVRTHSDLAVEDPRALRPNSFAASQAELVAPATSVTSVFGSRGARRAIAVAALGFALVAFFMFGTNLPGTHKRASPIIPGLTEKSIAVLPFLDLTEGMKEEEFADGMTEELIDRLIKVPGFRVPPPTSSFYFKNKQIPVVEIAQTLGVTYVLDGSVRKSGDRIRIAARLIRAESGNVVWSDTYDRPFDDILMVQDDIAAQVTKSLTASIEAAPPRE